MMENDSKFVLWIGDNFDNALPNASPQPNDVDMRNVSMPTLYEKEALCFSIAVSFRATEGQTLSGSIGPANVPVGLFVTDNASFYKRGYQFLYSLPAPSPVPTPVSSPGCTSDSFNGALIGGLNPIANLEPSEPVPPYTPIPSNYVMAPQTYTTTIPFTGVWWIAAYFDPSYLIGGRLDAVRWKWSAFLSPQTYVTTMTSFTTVTSPITMSTIVGILQTEALAQAFTFTVSADQLYAGLAVVFAVLFVVTLAMLLRQRKRKRKR
jgi:hypothetical protein